MLVVHISGLTAAEKTPSVRLIKAIGSLSFTIIICKRDIKYPNLPAGAKVTEQLSRRNTHLICPFMEL